MNGVPVFQSETRFIFDRDGRLIRTIGRLVPDAAELAPRVGKQMSADLGYWDAKLFDYEAVYDTEFALNKAERLQHHETLMTHAMLFTGVDVLDGKPRRWRVENSWGDEKGADGFWTMNDSWYAEHVFEIAVRRSALPAELQARLDDAPIVLPAWDPMGALAD